MRLGLAFHPGQAQIWFSVTFVVFTVVAIAVATFVAFAVPLLAVVVILFSPKSLECVFPDSPLAWFFIQPTANSHLINGTGFQLAQRHLGLGRLGDVIPVGGLALDTSPQLNVIKHSSVLPGLRRAPVNHGGRRRHFSDLDVARLAGGGKSRLAKR